MIKMYKGIANSPEAELIEGISAQATIIKVSNIGAFPEAPNLATIGTDENAETIRYAAKTADSLSGCERGIEGVAKSWEKGEIIARNFTHKDHADLIENVTSNHSLIAALNAEVSQKASREEMNQGLGEKASLEELKRIEQKAEAAFTQAGEGKTLIANTLTGKGIPTDTESSWAEINEKINKETLVNLSDPHLRIAFEGNRVDYECPLKYVNQSSEEVDIFYTDVAKSNGNISSFYSKIKPSNNQGIGENINVCKYSPNEVICLKVGRLYAPNGNVIGDNLFYAEIFDCKTGVLKKVVVLDKDIAISGRENHSSDASFAFYDRETDKVYVFRQGGNTGVEQLRVLKTKVLVYNLKTLKRERNEETSKVTGFPDTLNGPNGEPISDMTNTYYHFSTFFFDPETATITLFYVVVFYPTGYHYEWTIYLVMNKYNVRTDSIEAGYPKYKKDTLNTSSSSSSEYYLFAMNWDIAYYKKENLFMVYSPDSIFYFLFKIQESSELKMYDSYELSHLTQSNLEKKIYEAGSKRILSRLAEQYGRELHKMLKTARYKEKRFFYSYCKTIKTILGKANNNNKPFARGYFDEEPRKILTYVTFTDSETTISDPLSSNKVLDIKKSGNAITLFDLDGYGKKILIPNKESTESWNYYDNPKVTTESFEDFVIFRLQSENNTKININFAYDYKKNNFYIIEDNYSGSYNMTYQYLRIPTLGNYEIIRGMGIDLEDGIYIPYSMQRYYFAKKKYPKIKVYRD